MPPNGEASTVQKSGFFHGAAWLVVGLLIGVCLAAVAAYFAMRNEAFQHWLRNYFVNISIQQFSEGVDSKTTSEVPLKSFATASTTIAVPKAYATVDYYTAINKVYFDYSNLITVGGQIAPLFNKLNAQTVGGNYGGVIDLAIQIKTLIAKEKEITVSLGQDLVALSVANQQTKDAVTKSLTQDLISTGNIFRDNLPAYFDQLDSIFSGEPPSKEKIAQVTASAQTTTDNLTQFRAKFQLILDHFRQVANTPQ